MDNSADIVATIVLVGVALLLGAVLGWSCSYSNNKELVLKQFCAPLCQPGERPDTQFLKDRIAYTCTSVRTPK